MAERTDQHTRPDHEPGTVLDESDLGFDDGPTVDPGSDPEQPAEAAAEATVTSRLRDRLASPFSGLFSVRVFLFVLAMTLVTMTLVGTVVPLGGLAGFVGIATAGFGVGLVDSRRRYLEFGLAGGLAAGLGTLLDHLVLSALGLGVPLLALGVGAGSLAGVVGHYFGRDLRDGLTRDL